MSQALYEHYKEALRRGHLAALRGRLDVAEAAYRAAAGIAPDRALPWTSLGGVLGRLGRAEEARAAYDAALGRSPDDEGALQGRAELNAGAGRRTEAAADFERLAGILERVGRITDATDAARRALELAESRSRRHEVERLGGLLRERGEDRPAVDALDQALRILEAVEHPRGSGVATDDASADAGAPASDTEATAEPTAEPAAPPPPDPSVLRAVADALLDDGDFDGASERLLALAALHRGAGRLDAAMDACLALLAVRPADPRLQREIAAVQLDWGWMPLAAEKVRLLARLADLDGDAEARVALAAFAEARGVNVPEASAPGA